MSNNKEEIKVVSQQQSLIEEFKEDVEKKLPFWLKTNKEELEEILDELENHIWDRATELAEGEEPTPTDIQKVIEQMGTPNKIASEYKRRGKPKFYIIEELVPLYQKMLIIVLGICGGINILVALASIGSKSAGDIFGGLFSGLFISCAIAVILITIQFVYLSLEGYLPEDFNRLTKGIPIVAIPIGYTRIKSEEKATETTAAIEQPVIEKEIPEEKSVRIIREKTIIKEPPVAKKYKAKSARHLLGKDYLSEGIIGIAFGIVIMILPFMPFMSSLIPDSFKYWIAILGALAFVEGFLKFLQALAGRMLGVQQLLMFLGLAPQALRIPLFLSLLRKPDILFDWLWTKISHLITSLNYTRAFYGVVWFIIAITILSMIGQFVRFIRLSTEGFPQDR